MSILKLGTKKREHWQRIRLLDLDCLLGPQHGLSKDLRRFTKQLDNGNVSMLKKPGHGRDAMTILNGQMKKKVICKLHELGPYQPLIKQ